MATKPVETPQLRAFRAALSRLDPFLLDPTTDDHEYNQVSVVYDKIASLGFHPISRQNLPSLFHPQLDELSMRAKWQVLVLKQLPNEQLCIPVVAITFSTKSSQNGKKELKDVGDCKIQVGIFKSTKPLQNATRNDVVSIGIRYELAEGSGDHDYAHVQMMGSMEKGAGDLPGAPDWLPDSQPAIPLDSDKNDASALLVNMVQSLYGPAKAALTFKDIWQGVTNNEMQQLKVQVPRLIDKKK